MHKVKSHYNKTNVNNKTLACFQIDYVYVIRKANSMHRLIEIDDLSKQYG